MPTVTALFGSLAFLGIVAAGFLMMFSPSSGRSLLERIGIAVGLFVLGSMLFQACCGRITG